MINLFKILPFLLLTLFITSASAASTSLFNGKDLAGWKIPSGNEKVGWYKAKQGILELRSGPKKKGSVLNKLIISSRVFCLSYQLKR